MEIFLDSASVDEIQKWLSEGILDGVTTNPSILLKSRVHDMEGSIKRIAELVAPRPVSVEVTTNDHDEMMSQATTFASWAANVVVKIPVINEFGVSSLRVVRALVEDDIRVNVTACLSYGQATLAAKVGATYVSIFAGRVLDEGHDASRLIRMTAAWLERWHSPTKIIVGSIREPINIQDAMDAGAHVITVPPEVLYKFVDHKYSRETVRMFNLDGREALEKMAELNTRRNT